VTNAAVAPEIRAAAADEIAATTAGIVSPDPAPAVGADGRSGDARRAENAAWLAANLRLLRLRLHRHALASRGRGSGVLTDWLVAGDDPDRSTDGDPGRPAAVAAIDAQIAAEASALGARTAQLTAAQSQPILARLTHAVGLSPLEEGILLLAAAAALDGAFAAAFAEVHGDSRRDHATLHLGLSLFAAGTDRILAADTLLASGSLRRLGLVEVAPDPGEPMLLRRLSVDDRVVDFLRGMNRIDERLVRYVTALPMPTSPAAGGELAAALGARLSGGQGRWPTVNLVGPADAGGREAVAAACRALAMLPLDVDPDRLGALDPDHRATLIGLLGREAVLADVAIVVDGTHAGRGSGTAVAIEDLVRTLNAPLVVMTPEPWPAGDVAVDLLPVRRLSRGEQRSAWRDALLPYPNFVNGEVDAIVEQFDFGPAAIAEVVGRAARETQAPITGRDLWDACRLQSGPGLHDLARRIVPAWSWDDIVVEPDVRAQLRELAGQVEHRSRVYETWGFGAQLGRGRGITALFAGQSGTGKTMAAEIIAGHLRLDLYRIDLAGVVSKYVGETEKNLRRVFDAAESSGSILLFDEADALFGTRTEVRDSHDRYANLEINYLLQAMEDYAGLAILATNRRAALDGAFVRRLRFIVEFPFPDAEARRQIWERVFPAAAELDAIDFAFLARLELPGGSIRAIAINAAFLAAADDGPIRMAHIVRASAREYTKLARPIGAAEFGEWLAVARR
jgi:hypothetical protein